MGAWVPSKSSSIIKKAHPNGGEDSKYKNIKTATWKLLSSSSTGERDSTLSEQLWFASIITEKDLGGNGEL